MIAHCNPPRIGAIETRLRARRACAMSADRVGLMMGCELTGWTVSGLQVLTQANQELTKRCLVLDVENEGAKSAHASILADRPDTLSAPPTLQPWNASSLRARRRDGIWALFSKTPVQSTSGVEHGRDTA